MQLLLRATSTAEAHSVYDAFASVSGIERGAPSLQRVLFQRLPVRA